MQVVVAVTATRPSVSVADTPMTSSGRSVNVICDVVPSTTLPLTAHVKTRSATLALVDVATSLVGWPNVKSAGHVTEIFGRSLPVQSNVAAAEADPSDRWPSPSRRRPWRGSA